MGQLVILGDVALTILTKDLYQSDNRGSIRNVIDAFTYDAIPDL